MIELATIADTSNIWSLMKVKLKWHIDTLQNQENKLFITLACFQNKLLEKSGVSVTMYVSVNLIILKMVPRISTLDFPSKCLVIVMCDPSAHTALE